MILRRSGLSRRAAAGLGLALLVQLAVLAGEPWTSDGVRRIDPADISLPQGYRIAAVALDLNYPSDVTFSPRGEIYIAEAGDHTYGTTPEKSPQARIIQVMPDGSHRVVYDKYVSLDVIKQTPVGGDLPEGLIPPITGVTWHDGKLYVMHRTRISTLDPQTGAFKTIVDKLPSWGFFHGGKVIFDPDGKMIFFQSTQGNAGPIDRHWMKVIEIFNKFDAREIPGEDVELTGVNFAVPTEDPSTPSPSDSQMTGVFVPLGTKTEKGQVIRGQKICNGAFFRADHDGSNIERIAWGLRSNYGYRFGPDGRLVTTQNSGNPIPPREIHHDTEPIYEVRQGVWYGWPDYYSSKPITSGQFGTHAMKHEFVLSESTRNRLLQGKKAPPEPLATLPSHSSAEGMVFGREQFGIPKNEILVAAMGTIVPHTVNKMPGFRVYRVNLDNGGYTDFAANVSGRPASATKGGGLERPIMVEWGADGALYILDFGQIIIDKQGMHAYPKTGVLWRVTREGYAQGRLLPAVRAGQGETGHHGGSAQKRSQGHHEEQGEARKNTSGRHGRNEEHMQQSQRQSEAPRTSPSAMLRPPPLRPMPSERAARQKTLPEPDVDLVEIPGVYSLDTGAPVVYQIFEEVRTGTGAEVRHRRERRE